MIAATVIWATGSAFLPDDPTVGFFGIAMADGACVVSVYLSVSIASRYISGTEVALVALLQVGPGEGSGWPRWAFWGDREGRGG